MYINDLGIGRIASDHSVKAANTARRKSTDSYAGYASVMRNALDRQTTTANPVYSTVDDIIIREAFEKMKTDPEWESAVMNKVKEYYTGDRTTDGTRRSYQTLTGQNVLQNYVLQNYMMQNLTGGLGFGFGNSLLGSWLL